MTTEVLDRKNLLLALEGKFIDSPCGKRGVEPAWSQELTPDNYGEIISQLSVKGLGNFSIPIPRSVSIYFLNYQFFFYKIHLWCVLTQF